MAHFAQRMNAMAKSAAVIRGLFGSMTDPETISFGGGAVNNTIMHIVSHYLPFGGVGSSGMGRYHGKYSFETFSHSKSILKSSDVLDPSLFAEPNRSWMMKLVNKFFR